MTAVGGVFLIASFVLGKTDAKLPADPAWVTVFICGIPLVYLALWRVKYNPGISKISSALLISIAMFAAMAIGDLFAAGEVAFIMAIGAILEEMTTNRARKGLQKLLRLAPSQARRIQSGTDSIRHDTDKPTTGGNAATEQEEWIPAERIRPGDILRILPGEVIPADGCVIKGESSVDQSVLTGESLPVDKGPGDDVFCGTVNCFGSVDIRAVSAGEDNSLQKLIRMVQEAGDKQAPMQRIADRCASWLVPAALGIAIVAGLVTGDLVRAVTVLVVFCPCALVLATPTAIMAAIAQATRHGVIIKSGEALEQMGKADTIVFDKTGTLTCGQLQVCDIIPIYAGSEMAAPDGVDSLKGRRDAIDQASCHPMDPVGEPEREAAEISLLSLAASAEAKSEHPLGKAIVACARDKGAAITETDDFHMSGGKGVCAEITGKKLFCGSEKYLKENGVDIDDTIRSELARLRSEGKASVLVAEQVSEAGQCIGILALSDVLRPGAKETVAKLASLHTRTILLSGDHQQTADYFARMAGISQVYADLLPEDKVKHIEQLQSAGYQVCMIGDGVNDAPALKSACVGVAMGSIGCDIAVEASDIALMSDDLSRIPYLKRLSDATVNTIRFSITLSMCINLIAVTLSVLGVLTPTTGALVHNAGSCFVVLIAALLYDRKFEE